MTFAVRVRLAARAGFATLVAVVAVSAAAPVAPAAAQESGCAVAPPVPLTPCGPSVVWPNDNRRPAGTRAGGALTVRLRAARGQWRPEGPDGPALTIEAFGEEGGALMVPAPLLRAPEGTAIVAAVSNELETPLTVHGLCARDGAPCPTLTVPARDTREVRFAAGRAGTYHYWASSIGAPIPFRELGGAFVVDPPGASAPPDRVFVITEWTSLTARELGAIVTADDAGEAFVARQPSVTFMVNGLSWPATERLRYEVGDTARWRVVNLSSQVHPMHLHGFYFSVVSLGDGLREVAPPPHRRRQVVTQLLPPGGTLAMTWVPERAGNWLFHCHLMEHVSPERRLPRAADGSAAMSVAGGQAHGPSGEGHGGHAGHDTHDASLGMAGLVLGVTVDGADAPAARDAASPEPRALTLTMRAGEPTADGRAVAGFALRDGGVDTPLSAPGPTVVLRRGEPVAITLENQLAEPTAIHWHGMELESYYDGVHGFSGSGLRQTPMIEPGGQFVARFTPPRAGTFIYHSHLHDHRQLSSGLYGALVVVAPGETFDPAIDHALVLGRSGITSGRLALRDDTTPVVLNGERAPRQVWAAGTTHHVRLVNITADDVLEVTLRGADAPATWTPTAKDGAPLPGDLQVAAPARQVIAVGETYDFDVTTPPGRRTWWLEVRTPAGKWQLQSQIVVR